MGVWRVAKFIASNLGDLRLQFILSTLSGFAYGLIRFFIPLLIAGFIDQVMDGDQPDLARFTLMFVSLYLIQLGFEYHLRRKGETVAPNFANQLRNRFFQTLLGKRSLWDVRFHSVYILSLINRVAEMSYQLIMRWIWSTTSDIVFIPAVLIYIALQNWLMAVFMVGVLIVFVGLGVVLTRRYAPIYEKINQKTSNFISRFGDFMSNIRTVKKLHVEPYALDQTGRHESELRKEYAGLKVLHANRWITLHLIFGVVFISSIVFFVNEVAQGRATVGVIVLLVYALDRILRLIESTIESVTWIVETNAYLKTLEPFVKKETAPAQTLRASVSWSAIRLRNIEFHHPQSEDAFVLRIDSLEIKRGEKIGIVGKSGHGKSTFFDLLARHFITNREHILLDRRPYHELPEEFFARHLSYITQDAELFSISLRDNILLGRDVPDGVLREIVAGCDLERLIATLKDGLDTMVGERGVKLSTGERQRVNIARGIVLNRDIYLLDEITSNLDRETERKILEYLFSALEDKTILYVTHRLENLRDFDSVLLFDQGRLIAQGGFNELQSSQPLFRELVEHPELMVRKETETKF
ncbi:MAG: ABC transporter ATP-binding protein [bacterium]|nr:ABC transporter ATP-binding protein [bacterium]